MQLQDTKRMAYDILDAGGIGFDCALRKEYDSRNYVGVYVYANEMSFVNTRDTTQKSADMTLAYLTIHPEATAKELCTQLGVKYDTIRYRIRGLRESGRLVHGGSTKAGRWIVKD